LTPLKLDEVRREQFRVAMQFPVYGSEFDSALFFAIASGVLGQGNAIADAE